MKKTKLSRGLAFVLSVAVLFSQTSFPILALTGEETVHQSDNLCEHHTKHNDECGYAEQSDCTYQCEVCVEDKAEQENKQTLMEETPKEETPKEQSPVVDESSTTITAFDHLETAVQQQTVSEGTEQSALQLPDTLKATVNAQSVTLEGVTWILDPANESNNGNSTYDSKQGSYCFTPVLPSGYKLADGVSLPEIWVTVGLPNLLASNPNDLTFDISEGWITIVAGTNSGTFKIKYGNGQSKDNVSSDSQITLTGSATNNQIEVFTGTKEMPVKLVFDNLKIERSGDWADAFVVTGAADITLKSGTENILSARRGYPGLNLSANVSVTIGGEGSLKLSGEKGGIGGESSASVTINDGTIDTGNISTGTLTITGGTITSGNISSTSTTITGGTITSGEISNVNLSITGGGGAIRVKDITIVGSNVIGAEMELTTIGNLYIQAGTTITNNGTVINNGNILIQTNGTLTNNATIQNNGLIYLFNDSSFTEGTVINSGGGEIVNSIDSLSYIKADGSSATQDDVVPVRASGLDWNIGWYVVNEDVTITERILVTGDIHLILADGYSLDATKGIQVAAGNSLTIYSQSGGTGMLTATEGIGSNLRFKDGGNITINGGIIKATGANASAAIGAAPNSTAGTITINGGIVTAICSDGAQGIGGGRHMSGVVGPTENGTFTTAANGNAFIITNSIGDQSKKSEWSGVIFEGNTGAVYGSPTLKTNAEIPAGKILTIGNGKALTIDANTTLTNSATILIEGGGTLTNNGIIQNNGLIYQLLNANFTQGALQGTGEIVSPQDNVDYIQAAGTPGQQDNVLPIRAGFWNWTAGWYVVNENTTISERIVVTGDVNLILADGCTLTAAQGITVNENNSLTIYRQNAGTGTLKATGGSENRDAGIGKDNTYGAKGGAITITGGIVEATGGLQSLGINSDSLTISGGTVKATGNYESGINAETVTITGGIVEAVGSGTDYYKNQSIQGTTVSIKDAFVVTKNTPASFAKFTVSDSLILNGATSAVHGSYTLSTNAKIPTGLTLEIPDNATLTIAAGTTLTNEGGITIRSGGTLTNNGTLTGSGTIMLYSGGVFTKGSYNGSVEEGQAVDYVDADGQAQSQSGVMPVAATYSTWKNGWFYVDGDITIENSITVVGEVHLILKDGSTLDAKQGIEAAEGNKLTIYGQTNDTGVLTATGTDDNGLAGIGGSDMQSGGTITINGGHITATGDRSAGIGGGYAGTGGTVTINGGTVNAIAGIGSAGIGGGWGKPGGTITITGGTVIATGQGNQPGIGGSDSSGGSTITIEGGIVTATGGAYSNGIGDTSNINGSTVTITGGTVTANHSDRNCFGIRGTFTTGTDGNAFILATSINDKSAQASWSGVIFEGNSGAVYGSPITLTTDAEIPVGKTLTIEQAETFTIGQNTTFTNRGTIVNNGTITNNGTIKNYGIINPNQPLGGVIYNPSQVDVKFTVNGNEATQATYGDTVTITATAGAKTATNALRMPQLDTVDFYLGSVADENKLNTQTVNVSDGIATLEVTLEGEKWKPTAHTIWAVYGGSESPNLLDNQGNAQLRVRKVSQSVTNVAVSSTSATYFDAAPTIIPVTVSDNANVSYIAVSDTGDSWNTDVASISGTTLTINKVGTFYIKAVIWGTDYYAEKTIYSDAITVSKKPLTADMIADIDNQTYTGDAFEPTPIVKFTPVGGSELTLTTCNKTHEHDGANCNNDFYYSYANNTNAGTATVTVNAVTGSNYQDDTTLASKTFTINKVKLTKPTVDTAKTYTYNGEEQALVLKDFDDATMNVSGDKGTMADSYTATVSLEDSVNYEWADDSNTDVTLSWKIEQKELTADMIADVDNQTYTGQAIEPKLTVIDGEPSIITEADYTVSYKDNINVGTSTATITATPDGNYSGDISKEFTITKSDSTPTELAISAKDITYGEAFTVSFTPKVLKETNFFARLFRIGAVSPKTAELYYGDTLLAKQENVTENTAVTFTVNTADKKTELPASLYDGTEKTFTVKWGGDDNLNPSEGAVKATLSKKVLTAEVDTNDVSAKKVFDGTTDFTDVVLTLTGKLDADTVTATANGMAASSDVATSAFTASEVMLSGAYIDYYTLATADVSGNVIITSKEITADMIESITEQIYTGDAFKAMPIVKFTSADGLEITLTACDKTHEHDGANCNNDFYYSYANNTNVGTATITVHALTGGNYSGDVSKEFSIVKAKLTKPTVDTAKTYTYNGTVQTLVLKDFDAVTMNVSANQQTNVGDYEAVVALKDSANYEWADDSIENVTLDWTIEKAKLTKPTVDTAKTYTYNGEEQTLVLKDFDDATMNVSANQQTDVGDYEAVVALKDSANYEWADKSNTDVTLDWTIEKAERTITVNGSADSPTQVTLEEAIIGADKEDGTVEYARNSVNTVPEDGWQSEVEFTELLADTDYYFFARISEGTNYKSATSAGILVHTPEKEVSAVSITTQPTKLSYQSGEKLDLTGLVAEISYNDNTNEVIKWTDGKLSATPAHDTVLTLTKHHDMVVSILYGAQSDDTTALTVITGEQEPLAITEVPETIYSGDTFTLATSGGSGTGAVTWKVVDGEATVDADGVVTVNGVGDITIQAVKESDADYHEATAEITFTAVKVDHTPIDPPNPEIAIDTTKDAVITFNGDYADLAFIKLNGHTLTITPSNGVAAKFADYPGFTGNVGDVKSGSVIVTLYKEFLQTLSSGKYTLEVGFKDGMVEGSGSVVLKIEQKTESEPSSKPESGSKPAQTPDTGDSSTLIVWVVLMIATGGAVFVLLWNKKKEQIQLKQK